MDPSPRTSHAVRAALVISWVSIAWSACGGAASIASGALAGSLSLIGSGASVLIDLTSSVVLVWRFRRHDEAPGAERVAHLVAASALLLLSAGLAVASAVRLATGAAADATAVSLAVGAASAVVLPVIAARKYHVAARVPSPALRVDAHITLVGATTALLALAGLGLTAAGFGSADAIAAMVIAAGAGVLGAREMPRH